MTRNSQDDLFIFHYLLTKYIKFLRDRLDQEYTLIKNEYLKIKFPMISEESSQYIYNQKEFHCKSTIIYLDFLTEIQKVISDFYEKNQRSLPLYSIEPYRKNIKKHEEKITQIISELFEY